MDRSVNYFYTSCTRSDGWPSISRFHADLEYRLKAQEGLWVAGVLGPQTGSGPVLESGVAQVGVMVSLYSPEYFQDRDCGLEWAVFRSRMRRHQLLTGHDVSACLIPLVWKPVSRYERPSDTPDPQEWSDGEEGQGSRRYASQGLCGLMQSQDTQAHDVYFSLIGQLAKRIAEARSIGLTVLDDAQLRSTRSAFGYVTHVRRGTPARTTVRTGPGLRDLDPRDTYSLPPRPRSVAISYVGADQPWADWMEEILEADGHPEVVQVRWKTELESLAEAIDRARAAADRVVVVFSRSYFTAGAPDPLQWEEVFVGPGREWLIPVQIDAEPRPLLVRRGVPVVQLNGSDESQARLLRELVHDPGPPIPGPREGDAR